MRACLSIADPASGSRRTTAPYQRRLCACAPIDLSCDLPEISWDQLRHARFSLDNSTSGATLPLFAILVFMDCAVCSCHTSCLYQFAITVGFAVHIICYLYTGQAGFTAAEK